MGMPTVASVGAVATDTVNPVTVNPGATHTADDIDIVIAESFAGPCSLSTANGFAELTAVSPQSTGAGGTVTNLTVFWRRWNGTDGSPIITAGTQNHIIARMISISGVKTSGNPWNVTATGTTDSSADTSLSAAGATTTAADCLILAFAAQNLPDATGTTEFGAPTNASLTNLTERIDNSHTVGNGGAIWMASGELATAGTYSATTCTTVTSALRVCGSIALEGASSGVTGTIAATQESQFVDTGVQGPWSGTVANPITGTIAVTQAAQVGALSGTETILGTLAATQANQTGALAGTVANPITGTIADNQGDQAGAFVGTVGIPGTIAATQAPNVGALSGTVANPITGTIGATQDPNTAVLMGTIVSDGTLNAIQQDQTGVFTGTVVNPITGTIGATQADNVGAFTGISMVAITGTLAAIQADQTAVFVGDSSSPTVTGTIAAVQDPNVMAAAGISMVAVTGILGATQDPNVGNFIGTTDNPILPAPGTVTCVIGGPTVGCVLTAPSVVCTITQVSVAGTDTVITSTFRNAAGVLTDPAAVTAVVQHPDGTQTTPTPTSSSVGVWTTVIPSDLDEGGWWFGQVQGTGNGVNAVCKFSYCLEASLVLV